MTIWTKYQLYYAIYLDLFGKCESMFFYANWITRKKSEFRYNRKMLTAGPFGHDEIRFIKFLYECKQDK